MNPRMIGIKPCMLLGKQHAGIDQPPVDGAERNGLEAEISVIIRRIHRDQVFGANAPSAGAVNPGSFDSSMPAASGTLPRLEMLAGPS